MTEIQPNLTILILNINLKDKKRGLNPLFLFIRRGLHGAQVKVLSSPPIHKPS